jgi:sugar lactone lactonase YvrE
MINRPLVITLVLIVDLVGAAGCPAGQGEPSADGGRDSAIAEDANPPDAGVPDVATGGADASGGDAGTDLAIARPGLALPGDELYPEGIAVSRSGTFFIGSLREGLVLRASAASHFRAKPFIPAGSNGLVGVLGLLVDEAAGTLWVCSSDLPRSRLAGTAKTALKSFDLNDGAPRGSFEFPGGGRCNDLAIDSHGTIYATDSASPRLLRLVRGAGALEVWLEGEGLAGYLNGIVADGRDRLHLVTSDAGGLLRIGVQPDGRAGVVQTVTLSRKLTGPDGIEMFDDDTAIVVESSWNVSRIDVTDNDGRPTGLVSQIARVRRPTTLALWDGAAWIVEAQLLSLNNPDAGGSPELPFVVFRVELPRQ